MTENQAGLSALAMAYARAHHSIHDSPKIFDDFLAPLLFTPQELAERDQIFAGLLQYVAPELSATNPDPATATAWVIQLTNGPITLPRSRYAEDNLEESLTNGVQQYVILGAGLDTFAYRRPDLADQLQIFELDHPATQAIKRERVTRAGRDHPQNLHVVPVDFSGRSPGQALGRSPYRADRLSFFSWLGVSFYLARDVVLDTLRSIASIALPGSQIVFDYLHPDAYDPEKAGTRMQQMQWMAAQLGEPMKSGFDPLTLDADLEPLGLHLVENLDPAAIQARYFQDRSDRYHAVEHFYYAKAVV